MKNVTVSMIKNAKEWSKLTFFSKKNKHSKIIDKMVTKETKTPSSTEKQHLIISPHTTESIEINKVTHILTQILPKKKRKPSFRRQIPKGLQCQFYEDTLSMRIISMSNLLTKNPLPTPKVSPLYFEYLHSEKVPVINGLIHKCFLERENDTIIVQPFSIPEFDVNNESPNFLDTPKRYCLPNFNPPTMMFPEPISFSDLSNPSISPIRPSTFLQRKIIETSQDGRKNIKTQKKKVSFI